MTRRRTPRLATLLLERLGPANDALLGDLAEEYPGRTVCVLVTGARRSRPSSSARAGTCGRANRWPCTSSRPESGCRCFSGWCGRGSGSRAVFPWKCRTSRSCSGDARISTRRTACVSIVAQAPGAVLVGWVLAKLHMTYRGPAVMTWLLFSVLWNVPRLVRLSARGADDPAQSLNALLNVVEFMVATAAFALGGVLAPLARTGTSHGGIRP